MTIKYEGIMSEDDFEKLGTTAVSSKNDSNALQKQYDAIKAIAGESQSFLNDSLMGRGLQVSNFSSTGAPNNWSKNYPYRFIVTTVDANGRHSEVAQFRLPINPQQLSITSPFAIKTTVTSRGILEEHNGVPIKQISFSGTTGIYIAREESNLSDKKGLGSVFAGTVDTFNTLVKVAQSVGQSPQDNVPVPALAQTGYFQFQMLDLFLHTYAETKKVSRDKNMRLVFEMAKDGVRYIVTPVSFVKRRDISSPMEYMYTCQLLAWGTVKDWGGSSAQANKLLGLTNEINDLQKINNGIQGLRRTLQAARNVVKAVQSDIETNIFGPINQVILATKDLLGLAATIADFPNSLRNSFQTSVVANWDSLKRTLNNDELINKFDAQITAMQREATGSTSYVGAPKDQQSATNSFKSSVFDDIELTDAIQINQLQLTATEQAAVTAAIDDAKDIRISDIETLIDQLGTLSTSLEAFIQDKDPLDQEWDILYALAEGVTNMYSLIAGGSLTNSANEKAQGVNNATLATSAMAFWTQTAQDSAIPFTRPQSKFFVPFPFGSTLEQLSLIYLGDSTRWMEIVALNGLQAPYIDEDGFTLPLLTNAQENQITVGSDKNLYVNQPIFISADNQLTVQRKIQSISMVSEGTFLLTLDSTPLIGYTLANNAQMRAYLPNTINSMKQIAIPLAQQPAVEDPLTLPLTFLPDDPEMIKFSRIDWLLDSNGDLAVTKDGFMNLAFGKTNLMQAAKMKLITPAGSLLLHPEYGAGVEIGSSVADLNLTTVAKRIDRSFTDDPRFLSPSNIELNAQPGVLYEQITAVVSKDNGVLPITLPLSNKS